MKRCVLIGLMVLLAANGLQGEPTAPASTCDHVFLWLAGGLSSARIERLLQAEKAQSPENGGKSSCPAAAECPRALRKAGADEGLIRSLTASTAKHKSSANGGQACATPCSNSCSACSNSCSDGAAEIAGLVHDQNFDAAKDKIGAALRSDANTTGNPANRALLQFVLGTILRRQSRFDEAVDAFTESARLMPGFPETHNQLSYLFYQADDSEDALAEARTALSIDPANAEGYRYLGLALYSDGHYDAAAHAYEEALAREPEGSAADADVYFDMGVTRRDQGDLRRAAIAYRHAISLRPGYWEAHSNLGVVLHDQGKLDEAIAEYRAAKRLNPDETSVRNNLGNTLCDKEDFDGAIAEFNDLYRDTPDWDGGHNCMARAYMSKRDYPSAIRELHAAIVVNPTGAVEHRVLGQVLLLAGKDEEAVGVLREAVSLNPDSGPAHHYLGTALADTQQLAEAEKEFREALRLEPNALNHYSLAACLMALNRYEDALGELEIASRMDPNENLYRARMQEVVRLITSTK